MAAQSFAGPAPGQSPQDPIPQLLFRIALRNSNNAWLGLSPGTPRSSLSVLSATTDYGQERKVEDGGLGLHWAQAMGAVRAGKMTSVEEPCHDGHGRRFLNPGCWPAFMPALVTRP